MNPKMPDKKTLGKNSFIVKKYRGMQTGMAVRRAADEVSDNGRCWWVKKFIIMNSEQKWKGGRHR